MLVDPMTEAAPKPAPKDSPVLSQLDCRVLLVEDGEDNQRMIAFVLTKAGAKVTVAENGRVGLEKMQQFSPDLILLDLMMPEVDGFEFINQKRRNPAWAQIPVVVLTAKEITPADREKLNGHVKKILQKGTYDRAALLDELRQQILATVHQGEI